MGGHCCAQHRIHAQQGQVEAATLKILLDEPFSALEIGLRVATRKAVAEMLERAGSTTILVTHDQAEALSLADHVAASHGVVTHLGFLGSTCDLLIHWAAEIGLLPVAGGAAPSGRPLSVNAPNHPDMGVGTQVHITINGSAHVLRTP